MSQQHYRMTLSEARALHQCGLISSTALLYFFCRIRLAPGWKMTLHQREISKQLGISRTAFYKAISKLKSKKLIDWEAPNGVVVCCEQLPKEVEELSDESGTKWTDPGLSGQNGDSLDKSGIVVDKSGTAVDKSGTAVDKSGTAVDKSGTELPLQVPPDKDSPDSTDSYQIFINSLSNLAREKFLNFVREKISDFPKPINDVEGWLASKNQAGQYRGRVYYEMFQQEVGEALAPSQDWEKHPKWETALAAMRTGVPRFIVLGQPGCDDLDKQTRQAMADYAEANNLIWGEES